MISMTLPQWHRRECFIDGRRIRLGRMLSRALSLLLVAGPDRFVSRTEFIEALWPNRKFRPASGTKIVDIYVCRLRAHGVPITTYWGEGWQIPRHAREAEPLRLAA